MMKRIALWLFCAALAGAAEPAGEWRPWAPRTEIAPRTYLDPLVTRSSAASLAVSGNSNSGVHGGWERSVPVEPGKWYRFSAYYRSENLSYERGQVLAILDWQTAAGTRSGFPEFAARAKSDSVWRRLAAEAPAPPDAHAARLQLFLSHAPQGVVWWDDVSFEAIPPPPPRPVTIVSLNLHPEKSRESAASVAQFVQLAERVAPAKTDIIVLPEGITVVGTRFNPADAGEPVPGPTTIRLGELARKTKAYVVAGLYERVGTAVYNTAVLIDRRGQLAGKYRKVYLPREEYEDGLTPGLDYPVFETDFGKIGMMICWDVQYADPARALALRGAELILLPIWGGNTTLARARAIENQVFIAASGYDFPTEILDPLGAVIAEAPQRGTAAIATIDLNRRYVQDWLGNMRPRFQQEIRLEVPVLPHENE